MDGTMSPADMAAVMGNEGAGGCGGGMWIFALLILLAIGGGGVFSEEKTETVVQRLEMSRDPLTLRLLSGRTTRSSMQ